MMRFLFPVQITLFTLCTLGAAYLAFVTLSKPDQQHIVLTDEGFVPKRITIQKGESVIFSSKRDSPFWPASNSHPDHFIYPEFDPKSPLQPDEVWVFRFDRTGVWNYHDHFRSYFTGTISVE